MKYSWNMTRVRDKEKYESPTGIEPTCRTSRTPGGHSIHWATRIHGEQGHFYWVHMWQVSSILLGSALPNSSWVVISKWRWWILSSVVKCERWNIQRDMSEGERKIWVPDRNRTHDLPNTRLGSALPNSSWVVISKWRWLKCPLFWRNSSRRKQLQRLPVWNCLGNQAMLTYACMWWLSVNLENGRDRR